MLLPVVNFSQQSKFPDGKVSVSDVTAEVKRYSVLSATVRFTVPPEGVSLDTAADFISASPSCDTIPEIVLL